MVAVPGSLSDNVAGVWRIDDADHSFSTQPFRIKYARQDVSLSVMVSFNLVVEKEEVELLSLCHLYKSICFFFISMLI